MTPIRLGCTTAQSHTTPRTKPEIRQGFFGLLSQPLCSSENPSADERRRSTRVLGSRPPTTQAADHLVARASSVTRSRTSERFEQAPVCSSSPSGAAFAELIGSSPGSAREGVGNGAGTTRQHAEAGWLGAPLTTTCLARCRALEDDCDPQRGTGARAVSGLSGSSSAEASPSMQPFVAG